MGDDKLWFRTGDNTKDDEWVSTISQAINQTSKSVAFYTKDRIENLWQHEDNNFHCVCVDGEITSRGFTRAALYCLSKNSPYTIDNPFEKSDRIYSLEFGTSVEREVHLEVRNLHDTTRMCWHFVSTVCFFLL